MAVAKQLTDEVDAERKGRVDVGIDPYGFYSTLRCYLVEAGGLDRPF